MKNEGTKKVDICWSHVRSLISFSNFIAAENETKTMTLEDEVNALTYEVQSWKFNNIQRSQGKRKKSFQCARSSALTRYKLDVVLMNRWLGTVNDHISDITDITGLSGQPTKRPKSPLVLSDEEWGAASIVRPGRPEVSCWYKMFVSVYRIENETFFRFSPYHDDGKRTITLFKILSEIVVEMNDAGLSMPIEIAFKGYTDSLIRESSSCGSAGSMRRQYKDFWRSDQLFCGYWDVSLRESLLVIQDAFCLLKNTKYDSL